MSAFFCAVVLSLLYPWVNNYSETNTLVNRITAPDGFQRVSVPEGSFALWLRNLPLVSGYPPVILYDGSPKTYQGGHYAVVDIDVGENDLQQCADAIIRLYAEYTYSLETFENIAFTLTNGDVVKFQKWIAGYRPRVSHNVITWHKKADPDSSYSAFRDYLAFVFTYAGTYSLSQQLSRVDEPDEIAIGDIFIQGGFPGHAVLVVDMAVNKETGETVFLLCQGYMPAQDIHILKNLNDSDLSPWYAVVSEDSLHIPEWTFLKCNLKRF